MSDTAPPTDPDVPPLPPAEEFWTKYNNRLEFPFSTAGAVLLHVLVAVAVVLMLARMRADAPDRSNLPVMITSIVGLGEGSPGASDEQPDRPVQNEKIEMPPIPLADQVRLPQVRETLREALPDPTGVAIPDHKAAEFLDVDKKLAQALVRGAGPRGPGSGGVGNDTPIAQSFRWTLRFQTRDGRDFVYQLGALRAQILAPLPPDNAKCLLFEDLTAELPRGRAATDEDIQRLAGRVRFCDRNRDSVRQVAGALRLEQTPTVFYAFFPTDLTTDWAAKERAFRGADPKDTEETVFVVSVAGGRPDVRVVEQKLRKQ
jgi:hypothetical protein